MSYESMRLCEAYRDLIDPYGEYLQYAATLTLKQSAIVATPYVNGREGYYKRTVRLNEERLKSTLRYFAATLKHQFYGNLAKHPNKKSWACPLLILVTEGWRKGERLHIHAALGNIPQALVAKAPSIIESTWRQTDFGYRENAIKPIYNAEGWLGYITKDVGLVEEDIVNIEASILPEFIQQRI